MRFHPASAVAVASIGLLAVGAGSASGSAVVTGIRSAPSVTAGARLNVRLTVAGKGKTQLALLLSTDRRRSRDDIAIGKTSRPGAHKTWTARARVPRHMTPRLSYLLVCRAGSRSCRSASQRVAVLAVPHPVRLQPHAGAPTASAAIGPSGGSVAAGSPAITLTLPAGALKGQEAITVRPLSGLPSALPGRKLGAALLEPGGTVLGVVGRATIAAKATVGVATDADGRNVHLVPASGGIPVTTLGGVGFLSASPAAVRSFVDAHPAANPLGELAQLVAARKPGASKAIHIAAAGPDKAELFAYVYAAASNIEASPDIDQAMAQYELWKPLADSLLAELPQVYGLEALVRARLDTLAHTTLETDDQNCELQHDLASAAHIGRVGGYGAPSALQDPALDTRARQALGDCLRFALAFDSTTSSDGQQDDGSGGTSEQHWTYELTAYVGVTPVVVGPTLDFTSFDYNGSAVSSYARYEGSARSYDANCTLEAQTPTEGQGFSFDVTTLGLHYNADQNAAVPGPDGKPVPPVTFTPEIDPGLPSEATSRQSGGESQNNGAVQCEDNGTSTWTNYGWRGLFSLFHLADASPRPDGVCSLYAIRGLAYGSGDNLAEASYTNSANLGSLGGGPLLGCDGDPITEPQIDLEHLSGTESTTVKIVHCPRRLSVDEACRKAGLD